MIQLFLSQLIIIQLFFLSKNVSIYRENYLKAKVKTIDDNSKSNTQAIQSKFANTNQNSEDNSEKLGNNSDNENIYKSSDSDKNKNIINIDNKNVKN